MIGLDCPAYAAGSVRSGPDRTVNRPNTAPAYYLGHPASLWLIAMRRHRSRTAPVDAAPIGQGRSWMHSQNCSSAQAAIRESNPA
jgi:hypothetical protein